MHCEIPRYQAVARQTILHLAQALQSSFIIRETYRKNRAYTKRRKMVMATILKLLEPGMYLRGRWRKGAQGSLTCVEPGPVTRTRPSANYREAAFRNTMTESQRIKCLLRHIFMLS